MKKIKSWFGKNKITILLLSLITLLTVVILLPIFRVDFVGDNAGFHRAIRSFRPQSFSTIFYTAMNSIYTTAAGGRIHLTTHFPNLITQYLNIFSIFWSFIFTVIMTLINVYLLYRLYKKVNLNKYIFISLCFLPLLFQIRAYHDPFIVYFGSFQLFFSYFLISAIFFVNYLQKNKISSAVWSLIFFWLSANSHEANIMFWPCMVIIFWLVTKKFWTKKAWPLIVDAIICVCAYFAAPILQFILRIPQQEFAYNGTAINFNPLKIIATWIAQIMAALPLNSFLGRTGQEAMSYYPHLFIDNLPILFFSLVVFGLIFYLCYKYLLPPKKEKIDWQQVGLLSLLGLSLWIFPALPVAVSEKYQFDLVTLFGLRSGYGYLMVYYQYFGVAILAGLAVYVIFNQIKWKKIFLTLLTVICATTFYFSYCSNLASVKQVNKAYDEHSFLINQAKKTNFFDNLPKFFNIFTSQRDNNYYVISDRELLSYVIKNAFSEFSINQVCTLPLNDNCKNILETENNNYFFYYDQVDEYSGYIILTPIKAIYEEMPIGEEIKIYYYSAYLNDNWAGGIIPKLRRDLLTSYYTINDSNQLELKQNKQWITRDRATNSTIIEIDSEQPIILDSIVPALIQNDHESLKTIFQE
ncbi:MAG: hypothetical protein Q4G02_00935 [bacterium]|nr:hypothetical protein [bacterium]